MGVFSGLNNLSDITLSTRFGGLCGYTQDEVEAVFADYIEQTSAAMGITLEDLKNQLRHWYNGYQFAPDAPRVYNPFSTLKFFYEGRFQNYWFATGTPTFLLDLIQEKAYPVPELENLELSEHGFDSFEIERLQVEPLLYQTGYLTIKSYNPERMLYRLDYPNYEVEAAFIKHLADRFGTIRKELIDSHIFKLIDALAVDDVDGFFDELRVFFADIPYDLHIKQEKYYHTIFYLIFKLLGYHIEAEVHSHKGRADAVIATEGVVYVMEFKLFDTAESALAQIKEKGYSEPYRTRGVPVVLMGVEFDAAQRNVGRYVVERE